jgi:xanthosine utilization system XapX-like protein
MRLIGNLGTALVALAVGLLVLFVFFAALGAFSPAETIIASIVAGVAAVALGVHMHRVHKAMGEGHGSDFHRSLNKLRERRGF